MYVSASTVRLNTNNIIIVHTLIVDWCYIGRPPPPPQPPQPPPQEAKYFNREKSQPNTKKMKRFFPEIENERGSERARARDGEEKKHEKQNSRSIPAVDVRLLHHQQPHHENVTFRSRPMQRSGRAFETRAGTDGNGVKLKPRHGRTVSRAAAEG